MLLREKYGRQPAICAARDLMCLAKKVLTTTLVVVARPTRSGLNLVLDLLFGEAEDVPPSRTTPKGLK